MSNRWFLLGMCSLIVGGLLFGAAWATAAEQGAAGMQSGKRGKIAVSEVRQAGDLTLQPGVYRVQHRVKGSQHVMEFVRLRDTWGPPVGFVYRGEKYVGDAKCEVIPLESKVQDSSVTSVENNSTSRIIRIEIRGEKVAHVF